MDRFSDNEKIILSILGALLIAMVWLGVNVADLKEIVQWLIGG